jgi:site-specific recombinase XerD
MSFEKYLKEQGYKVATVQRYLAWLKGFKLYFSIKKKGVKDLVYNDLLAYLNHKEQGNLKRSTLVLLLGRIKKYYQYLKLENPLVDFKLKGYENGYKAVPLSKEQLEQIIQVYRQNKRLNLGSKVALSLLIYQGLSTHELSLLSIHHLDLQRAELNIPSNRLLERTIALEACQILDLLNYAQCKQADNLLFHYTNTSQVQNRHYHWKNQIKVELKKQGLSIPFSNLQQFRNSRIAHWINEEGILKAQYLAGHHRLSSTQQHQSEDHQALRAAFEQVHPLF